MSNLVWLHQLVCQRQCCCTRALDGLLDSISRFWRTRVMRNLSPVQHEHKLFFNMKEQPASIATLLQACYIETVKIVISVTN